MELGVVVACVPFPVSVAVIEESEVVCARVYKVEVGLAVPRFDGLDGFVASIEKLYDGCGVSIVQDDEERVE